MSTQLEDLTKDELVEFINSLAYDIAPDGTGESFELHLTEDITQFNKEQLIALVYQISDALQSGARNIII